MEHAQTSSDCPYREVSIVEGNEVWTEISQGQTPCVSNRDLPPK